MSGKDTYYIGEQSLTFPKDVYIISSASVVGKKEGEGPLGGAFDMICESYRNVSCLFKEAEKDVREWIEDDLEEYRENGKLDHFNEYGIDLDNPYEGLFLKTAKRRMFTINHTKKIYYTLAETDMLFLDRTKNDYGDPLPILMGYGRVTEPGEWLGDVIGVSDQRPEGYSLIKEICMKW